MSGLLAILPLGNYRLKAKKKPSDIFKCNLVLFRTPKSCIKT